MSVFLVFAIALLAVRSTQGELLDQWTQVALVPRAGLNAVSFVGDTFLAVGEKGTVLTSTDGRNWVSQTPLGDMTLRGISAGEGMIVIVGDSGSIFTSRTGATWTQQVSNSTNQLNSVAFGNGTFVVVGGFIGEQEILTSADGIEWTRLPPADAQPLFSVAFGKGRFVAVGGWIDNAGNLIWSSSDGITWVSNRVTAIQALRGIAFGRDTFVAVGFEQFFGQFGAGGYSVATLTSDNGMDWAIHSIPGRFGALYSVAYGEDGFVGVGGGGLTWASPTGIVWTEETPGFQTYFLAAIAYARGAWIVAGSKFAGGVAFQGGVILAASEFEMEPRFLRGLVVEQGKATITLESKAGLRLRIERSSDLNVWTPVLETTNSTGRLEFIDTDVSPSQQFYRANAERF